MLTKETKTAIKVSTNKALSAFWDTLGGDVLSTSLGVTQGILSAAFVSAVLPGGSETKDVIQVVGTMTAGILGYKYTHDVTQMVTYSLARWHEDIAERIERAAEEAEEATTEETYS